MTSLNTSTWSLPGLLLSWGDPKNRPSTTWSAVQLACCPESWSPRRPRGRRRSIPSRSGHCECPRSLNTQGCPSFWPGPTRNPPRTWHLDSSIQTVSRNLTYQGRIWSSRRLAWKVWPWTMDRFRLLSATRGRRFNESRRCRRLQKQDLYLTVWTTLWWCRQGEGWHGHPFCWLQATPCQDHSWASVSTRAWPVCTWWETDAWASRRWWVCSALGPTPQTQKRSVRWTRMKEGDKGVRVVLMSHLPAECRVC